MRAIYPGTFDPMTNGHIDIAKRGSQIFEKLIIGVSENKKKGTLFTLDERVDMAREALKDCPNIDVVPFKCLLMNFMKKVEATAVIRGLRAVSDFEFEFQLALMNRELDSNIETVFLMPNKEYIFLSSSMVREIASLGGDVSDFVPLYTYKNIRDKYGLMKDSPC